MQTKINNKTLMTAAQFVINYYDEAHRYYHNIDHINKIFDIQEKLNITLTPIQILAINFHDIVYLPGTPVGFNENQSVTLLNTFAKLNPGSIDNGSLTLIGNIILDTIDHKATNEEANIVLDLDLYGLSQEWEEYCEDGAKIRAEYILVNDEEFKTNRVIFLSRMLSYDKIYHTDLFYNKFEKQARSNLQRELNVLLN